MMKNLLLVQNLKRFPGPKSFLVILIIYFSPFEIYAANIQSAQSGAWSSTSTWSGGIVPGSGDDVTINAGHTVTLSSTRLCTNLYVGNGNGSANLTFSSGSQLTVSNTVRLGDNGSGKVGVIDMTSGGTLICTTLSVLGQSPSTFTSGQGTLQLTGTNSNLHDIFSTFNNLTVNSSFTVGFQSTTVNFTGNLSNNGTVTLTGKTTNFNGSTAQSLSGSGTTSFGTLNITNTGGAITANQNFSVTSSATVNSNATLNMGTAIMSGSGTFTLSSGGNLGIGSANGIVSSGASGNIQVNGMRNFSTGGNYNYNGAAQSLGSGLPGTVNNLTFSGTGTKTATASRTINGNLTIESGATLNLASGATYDIKGDFTNNGSAVLTGSTFSFSGSGSQTIGGTSNTEFGTLRINNTTTVATSFGTTATVGNVYIASGSKMNLNSGTNSAVGGSLYLNNFQQYSGTHGSTTSTATYKNDTYFSLSGLLNVAQGAPLPVELVSFVARNVGQTVVLKWTTASEINSEKFMIERSKDGSYFQAIGELLGAGTTSQTNNYTFTDSNPLAGINYYRLKQLDFDGGFEYSHVQTVYFKKTVGDVQVFPTVTNGEIQILLTEDPSDATILSVYSLQGALLSQQALEGNGTNYTVTLPELPSGQYLIEVKTGNLSSKSRIFKQ